MRKPTASARKTDRGPQRGPHARQPRVGPERGSRAGDPDRPRGTASVPPPAPKKSGANRAAKSATRRQTSRQRVCQT